MSFGRLGTLGRGFGRLGALGGASTPLWVLSGASIDMDFANGLYFGSSPAGLTVTRASSKTNLFPTSTSGFAYSTFLSNVAAITPGSGLSVEEARTNVLLNSTAPVTQTTASLATGTYTLWANGSGSATSSAGSATITGAGAATNGTPNVFVVTVAGTVTITVSGSLNAFQCELNPGTVSYPTSFIVTAGTTATRAADLVTMTSVPAFGPSFSFFAQAIPQSPVTVAASQSLLNLNDGTLANRYNIGRNVTNGNWSFSSSIASAGGYATQDANGGTWAQGLSGKTAFANTANGQNSAHSSALLGNGVTSALNFNAFTQINIGARSDAVSFWNGIIQRIAIWPSIRISNATLQTITT